ncbi:unnamed protein product [Orchesella dallaii]|uniref:Ion transport peptide n=1 Tax=Orchesella dallaii TaxID=48710 RepID=A0ABP1Q8S1_9HEXA
MNTSQNMSTFLTRNNYGRPTSTSKPSSNPLSSATSQSFRLIAGLLVLSVVLGPVQSFVMGSRPLSKRSFFDIQCKGVYDKGIFAKLDRICDDCYNLYREPQLHSLCRSNCFGSPYFKGCLDALLLGEEEGKFDEMIEILGHGRVSKNPSIVQHSSLRDAHVDIVK